MQIKLKEGGVAVPYIQIRKRPIVDRRMGGVHARIAAQSHIKGRGLVDAERKHTEAKDEPQESESLQNTHS